MPTQEAALSRAGDNTTDSPPGERKQSRQGGPALPSIRALVRAERFRAAVLAAFIAALAFCTGDIIASTFPFGRHSRSVSDLGNQFVPYHARLWDLLHGTADGNLILNWQSGYGSSFLPDFGTYLGSPFAPLVALFPRHDIDLAVYAITVLKMAAAGAAMACLLLTLRRGRWWAAATLGASYALCGWSVTEASYNPMWLDGLIAFPLLCLVGEWALGNRRPVLGPLVVALAWIANFYTAYMATIGAALVLAMRLLISHDPVRKRLAALLRAAVATLLGIALAAPLVLVIFKATKLAHPGMVAEFKPSTWPDVLVRLMPGTYSFQSPAVWVGTAALLLALTLPFNPAVPRRVRAGWSGLAVLVLLSMQWKPTHLAWHAFSTPNGSPYRQTFVLCGVLVIAGWLSFAHGAPRLRQLLAGTGLLAVIAAVGSTSIYLRSWTLPLLLIALAGVLGGLTLLLRPSGKRWVPVLAAALLIGAQVGETAVSEANFDKVRLGVLDDYAPWGQRQDVQRAAVEAADDWPHYRTDVGTYQTVGNDPLVVGGQGAQYYSSLTSDVLSTTLYALGGGSSSRGRSPRSIDNPVTDAIFSVGARLHSSQDPYRHLGTGPFTTTVTTSRQEVPPLVTVRPAGGPVTFSGNNPYRNQESLLGAHVYTVPRLNTAGTPSELTARCPAGSVVYLWAPHFNGRAQLAGTSHIAEFDGLWPGKRATMQPLGDTPASGVVRVALTGRTRSVIPAEGLGCLDRALLRARVGQLKSTGATAVEVSGDGLTARLPAGSTGVAVIAAPAISGWSCSVDGRPARPAASYMGLLSVPLDGGPETSVRCGFTPPGLKQGAAIGGTSLLALLGLAGYRRLRQRGTAD